MKLRCIVIDDEPLALSLLESYVRQTSFCELAGSFTSATSCYELVLSGGVDVVLTDIQMPGVDGMEFAKTIEGKAKVIFTTAFEQYAIDGYKVGAFDYLLKPVSFKTFYSTMCRLFASMEEQTHPSDKPDFLFVKTDGKFQKVRFDDIAFIEGLRDYVKIHLLTEDKLPILCLNRMKLMEEVLPENFCRVHKSFIINISAIDAIHKDSVTIGNRHIPLGDKYADTKALQSTKMIKVADLMKFIKKH